LIGPESKEPQVGSIAFSHPYERILHYEIKDHVNSLKLRVNRVMKPSKKRDGLIADINRLSELIKKL
jgi:hypothetical protein